MWKILLTRIGELICTVGELGEYVVKEIDNRKIEALHDSLAVIIVDAGGKQGLAS